MSKIICIVYIYIYIYIYIVLILFLFAAARDNIVRQSVSRWKWQIFPMFWDYSISYEVNPCSLPLTLISHFVLWHRVPVLIKKKMCCLWVDLGISWINLHVSHCDKLWNFGVRVWESYHTNANFLTNIRCISLTNNSLFFSVHLCINCDYIYCRL